MTRAWPALWAALFVMGCGDDRTRSVQAHLEPPGDADLGEVPVLNEKTVELPLLNTGRTSLLLERVALEPEGTPFSIKQRPDEVGIGETLPVVVSFVPPAQLPYAATLVLESSDPERPRHEVKLSGRGSTRAVAEVEPSALVFEQVPECGAAILTFELRSSGSADLLVQEIGFAPGSSPAFTFVGSTKTPAVVKSGRSVQLTVKYAAAAGASATELGSVRLVTTDPDRREIFIPLSGQPNRAPVPVMAPFGNAAPGAQVTLEGGASSDPDGDLPLTYVWTLRAKPLASDTVISDPAAVTTTMTLDPDLPGSYEVQLDVIDAKGAHACAPARGTVLARPAQKLWVELFQSNAKTDINLHLLRTKETTVGTAPDDCYYENPAPDWGAPGKEDDPVLLKKPLTGYEPEVISYPNPVKTGATAYTVVAEFFSAHLEPSPATEVTVRIYVYGELKSERKRTLQNEGEVWTVADIAWDSGVVTERP